MALRKTKTKVTKEIPLEFVEVETDVIETWTAKQLRGEQDRRAFEMMGNKGMSTVASYEAVLAWMSFDSSTFMAVDEDGNEEFMFDSTRKMTFDEFIVSWDDLGRDLQRWVMDKVVYEANPQWDDRKGKSKKKGK